MSIPLLEARGLTAGYGTAPVVRGVDLIVGAGEIVALLGANGAGKTTTLLAVTGRLQLAAGSVLVEGVRVDRLPTHRVVRYGIGMVGDDRCLIATLTVAETFKLVRRPVLDPLVLFPQLERLLDQPCGLLSGGEQQMVALARAASAGPKVLLIDELSQGLAPIVVAGLMKSLRELTSNTGTAVLLVEQHVRSALQVADRGYVLAKGSVVLAESAPGLLDQLDVIEATYLGHVAARSSE